MSEARWDGMLPKDTTCSNCGKALNADGGHPAELYAGTFNSLCYKCTERPAYIERRYRDGAVLWNVAPHLPSWRRDRETYYAYEDCQICKGKGFWLVDSGLTVTGGMRPQYCAECVRRFSDDPLRLDYHNRCKAAYEAADTLYAADLATFKKKHKMKKRDIVSAEDCKPFMEQRYAEYKAAIAAIKEWAFEAGVFS